MARTRTAKGGPGKAGASSGTAGSGVGAVLKFRNRSLSTFRGLAPNAYGDLSDVGEPYLTNVPAALAEVSDVVFDAATQRQQIVRGVKCIIPAWADVIDTDTLQDESTGFFYFIESVEAQPGIGYYPAPKILMLRMRSGISIASD